MTVIAYRFRYRGIRCSAVLHYTCDGKPYMEEMNKAKIPLSPLGDTGARGYVVAYAEVGCLVGEMLTADIMKAANGEVTYFGDCFPFDITGSCGRSVIGWDYARMMDGPCDMRRAYKDIMGVVDAVYENVYPGEWLRNATVHEGGLSIRPTAPTGWEVRSDDNRNNSE